MADIFIAMQVIISILLYLNIINSPGTYRLSEIREDVNQNRIQIDMVKSDPNLLNNVIISFQNIAPGITILDDGQLKVEDSE